MRLSLGLLALLGLSAPALAQDQPAPAPEAPAPAPEAQPPAPVPPPDANRARREALFDLGFNALAEGNLGLAERAFREAAGVPGDPARSAVAASFVERVQQMRARRPPQATVERVEPVVRPRPVSEAGRTERITVLGTSTTLGLALYGWALPGALGLEARRSPSAFVGIYMITAAGSFVVPQLVMGNHPVTPGQANLAFYGGTRGIWQGLLVGTLAAGELSLHRRSQGWEASMLLGSVTELTAGYHLARAGRMTAGQVRTMAAAGDLGLALGFGTGLLLRWNGGGVSCPADTENPACFGHDPDVDTHSRKMAAAGLVGSAVGLAGGYVLARHRENTWGDGEVLRGTIALGVWSGWGVADVARTSIDLDNRSFVAPLMVGGAVGVLLGDRLVRNTDFTVGQSMLIDLSMISGGMLGAGATLIVSAGGSRQRPYVLGSALGAASGFALSYWGFRGAAEGPVARTLSGLGGRGVAVIPTAGAQGQRGVALASTF